MVLAGCGLHCCEWLGRCRAVSHLGRKLSAWRAFIASGNLTLKPTDGETVELLGFKYHLVVLMALKLLSPRKISESYTFLFPPNYPFLSHKYFPISFRFYLKVYFNSILKVLKQ